MTRTLLTLAPLFALLITSACIGNGQHNQAYAAPTEKHLRDSVFVPFEEALRMVANYAPHAGYVVDEHGDTTSNTRAAWFSVEQLEALLNRIKADGGDGIRFYLGTYSDHYPDGIAAHIPPREYWGRNTLLLVPTRPVTGPDGHVFHQDYHSDHPDSLAADGVQVTADIENDASMCPPNCPGAGLIQPPLP
ncbi:hypothetical protein ACFOET_05830 [Parapedobacter deserti]|uniref:Uncharacterized protein n=1 Tax=Parapedobacter deserti TaxID=1912957 RepID=A0ABV7JJ52_9SPHI